jgi:DNA ligase-1
MLAAKLEEVAAYQKYPLLASPKLDGVRAMVINNHLYSRSMKIIPNMHLQERFGLARYHGLDGELIMGEPTGATAFRDTTSAVMSQTGKPNVKFYVFDMWNHAGFAFEDRLKMAAQLRNADIIPVEHMHVYCANDIIALEREYLAEGYEGVMLRDPLGPYKEGRSTLREGWLMKLKRFHDGEAVVLDKVELMHNDNVAAPDERGYMKRSSHQENKRRGDKLGALSVRDCVTGVQFDIGTGFTEEDRIKLWNENIVGSVVKYRYFPTGSKEKPRFPTFVGFRAVEDM